MIRFFDIKLPTELIVDASPFGLGAVLTQRTTDSEFQVVEYASRALSDTESRYSQTQREALVSGPASTSTTICWELSLL